MFAKYAPFRSFVLRVPRQPLQFAFDYLGQKQFEWKDLLGDISFREALYLASPELIKAVENYQALNIDKKVRLELSLFKYLIRAGTRCTPFGLFSGCSVGSLTDHTQTGKLKGIIRRTSLDMAVLMEIAEKLISIDEIKSATKFLPNSTIYRIGNNNRYIAYYFENRRKKYKLENVRHSAYLEMVLEFSRGGKKVPEICSFIGELPRAIDENLTANDIKSFIIELIDNQLLIPEIWPVLAGGDYFKKLILHIENYPANHPLKNRLKQIYASLSDLDIRGANSIDDYRQIVKEINKIGISKKHSYYFQTDHFQQFEDNTLSTKIPRKILKGIEALSRLSSPIGKDYLERFKIAFTRRYGSREVPLSRLFDQELGIKFQYEKMYNEFDLIADFQLKASGNTNPSKVHSPVTACLLAKYEQVLTDGLKKLELFDSDIKKLPAHGQKPLSDTFSALVELYWDDHKEVIFLSSVGGSTALNLISRFSQQSEEIALFVNEVIERESIYEPGKILAEINHFPDNRAGNVIKSKVNRAYEIVYLGNSSLPLQHQIFIDDLYVSVQHDKIQLRSEKLDKEVIPILSNAHNYDTEDALPVYKFLCELQFQDKREALTFTWPALFLKFKFLPRVAYKDMIFSKARWKIRFSELENVKKLKDWRVKRQIPQFVQIQEHDKFLLLNLENSYCVDILKSHCKKYRQIWVTEFLFTPENGLRINQEGYANEFVISYYKKTHEAA